MKIGWHRSESRSRRGISMIEVVIVVTVSVFMLGLAVTTIHLLLRAERHTTQNAWYATSLARFSRVFRQDVHAAMEAELRADPDGEPTGIVLNSATGRNVSFTAARDRVTRTLADGDTVEHSDVFYLPRGSTARFETTEALVRVLLHQPAQMPSKVKSSGVTTPPGRTVRIEAGLSQDHRFAAMEAP